MKIALVAYSYYSRDARIRRYAEALARNGWRVDVLCLKENFQPKEKKITLFFYPLPRKRLGKLWYICEYLFFFLYSFFFLSKNQFSQKYQVIHINNLPDFLIFSALLPKIGGTKIILDIHDIMPELYISKYQTKKDAFIVRGLKWLESLSLQFADYVLTANESFWEILLERNKLQKNKISVILNCPDPKIFLPRKTRLLFNDQRANFTLMYMGTVEKRFNLEIVLQAIPSLIPFIPNLQFILVPKLEDEGKYFQNLKLKIQKLKLEKYVKIFPPQPLEKIAKMLQRVDIGVVLTEKDVFTENIFPVKLLEFVQMEVPVIATKTKILSQNFKNDQIYFLEKNTPEEFTQAVLNLYKDKKKREIFARKAKEYLKKHNWSSEEKKYLKIIKSLGKPHF